MRGISARSGASESSTCARLAVAHAAPTLIDMAGPALAWEGDGQTGHVRGVAGGVGKLFGQIRSDIACLVETEYRLLLPFRSMVDDFSPGICIVGVAILPAPDSLGDIVTQPVSPRRRSLPLRLGSSRAGRQRA